MLLFANSVSAQKKPVVLAADVDSIQQKDTVPHVTLYFYRTYINPMVAPIKKVPIYLNDTLCYKLKANALVALTIHKEGPMVVSLDPKDTSVKQTIPINTKYGETYYFRCWIVPGLWGGKPIMANEKPEVGRAQLGLVNKPADN